MSRDVSPIRRAAQDHATRALVMFEGVQNKMNRSEGAIEGSESLYRLEKAFRIAVGKTDDFDVLASDAAADLSLVVDQLRVLGLFQLQPIVAKLELAARFLLEDNGASP
jgi:hypothetical protein